MGQSQENQLHNNYREHNLQLIQQSVNDIKAHTNQPQIARLFFNPRGRNPNSSNDINYQLYEEKNRRQDIPQNIYAMFIASDPNKTTLTPLINFDLDVNRDIREVMSNRDGVERAIHNMNFYQNKVEGQRNQYYQNFRNDPIVNQYYQDAINRTNANKQIILNSNPNFRSQDEKHILTFVIGHELAHLSFADRNNIRWDLMTNMNGRLNKEEQDKLSSAFYSINRGSQAFKTQHSDANYMSTRDETHSDIAGLFMMAYVAMKNGNFNEIEFKNIARNIQQARIASNVSNDINRFGSHNTALVFNNENLNKIINIAREYQSNPNQTNVYDKVLEMTENLFLQTLQKDGLIFKAEHFVDTQFKNNLSNNPEMVVSKVYQHNVMSNNKSAGEMFNGCVREVPVAYRNNCTEYLNGHQVRAVDVNQDKIIDYQTIEQAMQAKASRENTSITQMENERVIQEGKVLEQFVNQNRIPTMATGNLGNAVIDVQNKQLQFK